MKTVFYFRINYLKLCLCSLLLLPSLSIQAGSETTDTAPNDEVLVININHQKQFQTTLQINNVDVPFLIDTGANITAIPMKFAATAHLPIEKQIETKTAGGRSFAKLTHIKSLKIGNVELHDIEAILSQNLSEALLGMDSLKFFKMNQSADTLTLSINNELPEKAKSKINQLTPANSDSDNLPETTAITPIKKSVSCDANKHCITRFDNAE